MEKKNKRRRRTNSKFSHSIFSTVRRSNGTLGLYFTLKPKKFLLKLSARRDGPEKSTETRKG